MEDMFADASGLRGDATDLDYPFDRIQTSRGRPYIRNMVSPSTSPSVQTRDGLPIPRFITERVMEDRNQGTGAPQEEVVPPNDGLPSTLYLWGATAKNFTPCESIATTRLGGNTTLKWGEALDPGETDVVPGYVIFIPTGSAADLRAKGDFRENPAKRFPVWNIEMRRAMITGNPDDVALDPDEAYTFTIAIFDRSSQIHSGSGPLRLRFQPSIRGKADRIGGGEAS
jgi:hypothetical protein